MLSTSSPTSDAIFLSYSRSDQEAARQLRVALEQAGFSVFHDEKSIRSGDNWMDRLHQALQHCSAFIVLIGRDGVQRWVLAETQVALIRHFGPHDPAQRLAIFPVILPSGEVNSLPPFLSLLQIQRWQQGEGLAASFVEAIQQRAQRFSTTDFIDTCPYLGLSTFQRSDARLFFGRQAETLQALTYLGAQTGVDPEQPIAMQGQYCRWLQIEGNSGAGKSSLVNAGMLPLIEQGALWARTGFERWQILETLLPGEKPLQQLAEVLERSLVPEAAQRKVLNVYTDLQGHEAALSLYLRGFKQAKQAFLLVIDQFEELFTMADASEKRHFDRQLATALLDQDCPLFVISTVRIDFLEGFEQLARLSELYNAHCKRYLLKTISAAGLQEAIERPAALAGLDVSEVSTAILRDVAEEVGALPLVENALTILWEQRQGSRLSGEVYWQRGGVAGLLEAQADALLEALEQQMTGGRAAALELLLALTRINDEGRHTRRRLGIEEACQIAGGKRANLKRGQQVIAYLTGQRSSAPSQSQQSGGLRLVTTVNEQSLDLIHETLIRAKGKDPNTGKLVGYWQTLYEYIERNRERGFYRDQLSRRAQQWQASPRWRAWTQLANVLELRHYRRLRPERGSVEARFLRRSRRVASWQMGLVALLFAWVGEAYWWTLKHALPPDYMFTLQKFRLADWGWLPEPLPVNDMLEISAPNEPVMIGEDQADLAAWLVQNGISKKTANLGYPAQSFTLLEGFALSKYEITYEQYDYYVWQQQGEQTIPYPTNPPNETARGQRPVVNVSWQDAQGYLRWLSEKTGDTYRLPTEVEWEYAARAGTSTGYWWGEEVGQNQANCIGCGSQWDNQHLAPVGSFAPNPFGLYDTVGNVWEWTCSAWQVELSAAANTCSEQEGAIVLRGGAWFDNQVFARASARGWIYTVIRSTGVGFRAFRASRTP